jgi:hypothetical protein
MTLQFTRVFAIPGQRSIIDGIHPETGKSLVLGETLSEIQARYPEAIIMTWEEWREAEITRQEIPITWREITQGEFDRALNVLPPIAWERKGFLLGEPFDHSYKTGQPRFTAYLQKGGRCFSSVRAITVAEWGEII